MDDDGFISTSRLAKELHLPMSNVFDQLRKMGLIQKPGAKDDLTEEGLRPWAEAIWNERDQWQATDGAQDLPEPYPFDETRRSRLRAELDAYYARLYGITRQGLQYILDPAEVMGPDYPTETFRGLKNKELKTYGEYRTQRLVLAAWDAQ